MVFYCLLRFFVPDIWSGILPIWFVLTPLPNHALPPPPPHHHSPSESQYSEEAVLETADQDRITLSLHC